MEVSKLLVVWAMLSLALGCDHLEDNPDLDPVDGGEDPGDTDSDTDSDVDGDTDSDTDTETDEETDVDECPWNSGNHCTCDNLGELCEDEETICSQVDGDEGDEGICLYYTQNECPESPWGDSQTLINMGGGVLCFLSCDGDEDCPLGSDQTCQIHPSLGDGPVQICYPS